jgi:hydrogenase-4 component A
MNRFVIADPGRCIGCNTCMAACSTAHGARGSQKAPRLTVTRTATGTAPVLCRQCDDAPCARVCPVDAIRLADGAVRLDEKRCIGCKMCALACPFGAISPSGTPMSGVTGVPVPEPRRPAGLDPILAWDLGVKTVAVKCDLCDGLDGGPACVRVCPTDSLWYAGAETLDRSNDVRRLAAASTRGPALPLALLGEHD